MKRIVVFLFFSILILPCIAQGYDTERIELSHFIERMYDNEPFEGCRIVEDYTKSYLLSVVILNKANYPSPIAMNRVAQVKSQRNAGEFFNGTQIYSELIIRTPNCKNSDDKKIVETIEEIRVSSTGFVQQMQLLTSFDDKENNKVFVYYKKIQH